MRDKECTMCGMSADIELKNGYYCGNCITELLEANRNVMAEINIDYYEELKLKSEKLEHIKKELKDEIERAENRIVKMGWCTYSENKKYEQGLKFALGLLDV